MPYLGKSPQHGNYSKLDDFSGDFDGSDATHAVASNSIAITPVRPEALIISINGVIQEPTTDYTVSGTNITFTTAPTSGDSFFGVALGEQLAIGTPSDATITSAKLTGNLVTPGTLDVNGQELILDADGDTTITADTDDTIDIKIAGADDFQFTANTFTAQSGSTIAAQALTGTTGVFSSDVTGLTLNATGDTAASDNAALGYTSVLGAILTGQGSTNDVTLVNDADATVLSIPTGTTNVTIAGDLTLPASGELFIGDTVNGSSTTGLTINQGASDDDIFSLKSSDIAHGIGTTPYGSKETDTYFSIEKQGATTGGAALIAYAEDAATSGRVLRLCGYGGTATTAKSTAGYGTCDIHVGEHNGSGTRASFASESNLFSVSQNDSSGNQYVQFIVDTNGDIHYNGADDGAYDQYEDAQLTRALDLSHNKGTIDSKFDKFVAYNHDKLAELKLVGREEDGTPNHFINLTGMSRPHNGAIWQQYEKHENLLNAVYELAVEAVGEDKANKILDKNEIKLLSKNELLN